MFKKISDLFKKLFKKNTQKTPEINYLSPFQHKKNYSKVVEVEIDGEKWWHQEGFYETKPEDRKLHKGDVVAFKIRGYEENCFMVIDNFDFCSDISARALIGKTYYTQLNGDTKALYYSGFSTSFYDYRLATRDEIKTFLKEYKENGDSWDYATKKMGQFGNLEYKDILGEINI